MHFRPLPSLLAAALVFGCADEKPPEFAPGAQLAGTVTANTVELKWPEATDDTGVQGYLVRVDGEAPKRASETTYKLEGLAEATTYTFRVQATDAAGNDSAPLELQVTTTDSTPPEFARWAKAVGNSGLTADDELKLRWTHAADNAAVFDYVIRAAGEEVAVVPTGPLDAAMQASLPKPPSGTDQLTIVARDAAGLESPELRVEVFGERAPKQPDSVQRTALALSAGQFIPIDSLTKPRKLDRKNKRPFERKKGLFNIRRERRSTGSPDAGSDAE